jgi:transmembrane sensor
MANEEYNNLEDLVFSRSFRNWVLNENGPETEFWTHWVAGNPDKAELINQARAAIHALQLNLKPLPEETVDAETHTSLQKLRDGRLNLREIPFRPGLPGRRPSRAWTVAAIIAAIAIIVWAIRFYLHYAR